jgi:diamine N-acetyltransferase
LLGRRGDEQAADMADPAAELHLREITADNQADIEALVVTEEQSHYVGSVAQSIVEAAATPDARPWYRAVYAGDRPVGFVMISDGITVDDPSYLGPYYLWRLLIDKRYQGQGFGAATIRLIVDHLVRTRPDARVLLTSVVPGPSTPLNFYLRQGFRATGVEHEGETVLELDLPRPPED